MAQGPKASGGNAWRGISQPVDHDAVPAHSANASFQGPRPQGTSQKGFLELPFDAEAAKIKPHYEWQYHYAGRHAYWAGHWVLVTAPIQSARLPGSINPATVTPVDSADAPREPKERANLDPPRSSGRHSSAPHYPSIYQFSGAAVDREMSKAPSDLALELLGATALGRLRKRIGLLANRADATARSVAGKRRTLLA